MKDLLEPDLNELRSPRLEEFPGGGPMDTSLIGETAGRVWQHLAKSGPTSLKDLPKAVGTERDAVLMAIGWLAREGKITLEKTGKDIRARLTEAELRSLKP